MSEWWSYRPSDFLLFSARTWHRLFELYNAELWPAHLFAIALGLALVLVALKGSAAPAARTGCAMLAACWLWVAWAFHLQRYAAINWAASWFAAAFALEGLLLLAAAVGAGFGLHVRRGAREALGLGLLLFAIVVQPWLGMALLGRPWREAGLFGLVPDPTAVGTLGLLLLLRPLPSARFAWVLAVLLWPIPLLWCLIAALTQWTLQSQGGSQGGALPSRISIAACRQCAPTCPDRSTHPGGCSNAPTHQWPATPLRSASLQRDPMHPEEHAALPIGESGLRAIGSSLYEVEVSKMAAQKTESADVKQFEMGSRSAKDPDLKSWATKTLPTLKQHLGSAQQLAKKK